jgi:hypothetical protein
MKVDCTYDQYVEWMLNHIPTDVYYDVLLKRWAKFFGKENMIIRIYDRERMKEHVFHDFLDACGVPDVTRYPFSEDVNISPSYRTLEIIRGINKISGLHKRKKYARIAHVLGSMIVNYYQERDKGLRGVNFIENEISERILDHVEEGNRYVAKEYLGRDELFEPFTAKPMTKFSLSDLTGEEVIELFGYVLPRIIREVLIYVWDKVAHIVGLILRKLEGIIRSKQI